MSTVDPSRRGAGAGGTRGRRLAVVGALALALVVGIATISAEPGAVVPAASASPDAIESAPPSLSPTAATPEPPTAKPADNGKGKGGGKGNGNDDD